MCKSAPMGAKENGEGRHDHSIDFEKKSRSGIEGESDYGPTRDTFSSHSSEQRSNGKKNLRVPTKNAKKESGGSYLQPTKIGIGRQEQKNLQIKTSNYGLKNSHKPNKIVPSVTEIDNKNPMYNIVPLRLSELCEGTYDKIIEEVKKVDVLEEAPVSDQSFVTDDSIAGAKENNLDDTKASAYQNVEEMEIMIEMLEEELRGVAALEISLYSFVPEHGGSVHEVHTPARRLARLYIHACKHTSLDKWGTVAKNTVAGLALVAKSCGNDVPRLTFWLSNTVILREIISQAFVSGTRLSVVMRPTDSGGCTMNSYSHLQLIELKNSSGDKQGKMLGFVQQITDWKETSTFIAALEKLEFWIFSRIVESVWWQVLTPHMHSLVEEDLHYPKNVSKASVSSLGDPTHRSFSVNLWRSAFHGAFSRLCPARSGGQDCGCSPFLARLVMEQCVRRLDVAMFNAILRESASEMPTDPISDPIVDPKVLPIPAGNLSFGSGAQLKNAIGSWNRWIEEFLGMDSGNSEKENYNDNDDIKSDINCFCFLDELSNLLMLPKEMLLDKTIRNEVCPSIGLPLITRVLCNFTPDEYCPDPVPSFVLEELNSERLNDRSPSNHKQVNTVPHTASPTVYSPPLLPAFLEKLADPATKSPEFQGEIPALLRKGYTSDDDLDDLDDPLASFIDRSPPVSSPLAGDILPPKQISVPNLRYRLLRKVWRD